MTAPLKVVIAFALGLTVPATAPLHGSVHEPPRRLRLRALRQTRHSGMRRLRRRRRPNRLRERLRDGEPRARRADHAHVSVLRGVSLQAVHRVRRRDARATGQALARRRHPEMDPRGTQLRQDHHRPPPDPPHERPARLLRLVRHDRLALRRPGHRSAVPRSRQPAESAQLRSRRATPLQQHRLRAPVDSGQARLRPVAARVRRPGDLRSARHDQQPLPRRPHDAREEPRARVFAARRVAGR